jgi:Uma2 family endonuclease
LRRYATYQIPVYWIVDINRRVVEVHSQPVGRGKQAGYARTDLYQESDSVPVMLDGHEIGRAPVAELLP